jgi:hypothetical protein
MNKGLIQTGGPVQQSQQMQATAYHMLRLKNRRLAEVTCGALENGIVGVPGATRRSTAGRIEEHGPAGGVRRIVEGTSCLSLFSS